MRHAILSAPTVFQSASFMQSSKLLVVIDSAVSAYEQLVAGAIAGAIVIILSPEQDGVEQITRALQAHPGVTNLHIISHGAPGCLYLGNTPLSLDTIDRNAAQLQSWFAADGLTPQIHLYGCRVAYGNQGIRFVERLHQLTGASVAASETLTGSAVLGGNWQFEVNMGVVEPALAFDAATIALYPDILAPASFPLDLTGAESTWIFNNLNDGLQIRDASLTTTTANGSTKQIGAFDSGLVLSVGGQTFIASSADVSGETLTTEAVPLSNLNVTAQYQALQNLPVLRVLYSFQNSTNAPITVPISIFSNLGSDSSTTVEASSSGDQKVSAADRWTITSDQAPYANPVVTQVLSGAGVPVVLPSSETLISDNFLAAYSITIPANSIRTLMLFSELNPDAATAKQNVSVFDHLSSLKTKGLLDGLTEQQIAGLLNWDLVKPSAKISDVIPNSRASAVSTLTIQFSEPVKNFDLSDLQLTLNNLPISLKGATLTSNDNMTWTLGNMTNTNPGRYQLSLSTSNIIDFADNSLASGDSKSWLMDTIKPTVKIGDISPNPRADGVDTVVITFNEPIKNLDLSDLQLTLNNVPVSLQGATLSSSNNTTWTLANLDSRTTNFGHYELTLSTNDITDLVGNALTVGANQSWLTGQTASAPAAFSFRGKQQGLKLVGTKVNDRLTGTIKNDFLSGKAGKDFLVGSKGNDYITGGKGNDQLTGGDGNDILIGGAGNDRLAGGRGADLFVIKRITDGADRIADFNSTQDLIDLRAIFARPAFSGSSAIARFTQFVQLVQVGANTEILIDSNDNDLGQTFVSLATLSNVKAETVSARNFVIS